MQDSLPKKHVGTGRPKDLGKRASILEAARNHFLRNGFDRASMDAIAAEAGVSKLTIYSHFGNKDTLFKELIESECTKHNLNDQYDELLKLNARDGLTYLAMNFIELIFRADVIELHRVIISEAVEKPKISQLFYDAGPEHVMQAFIAYLKALHDSGQIHVDNFRQATFHYFNLLKGDPYFRCLLNLDSAPTPEELKEHALDCIDVFLRAYAPR